MHVLENVGELMSYRLWPSQAEGGVVAVEIQARTPDEHGHQKLRFFVTVERALQVAADLKAAAEDARHGRGPGVH